jgi:Mrp family chromosome partitioning ATPase
MERIQSAIAKARAERATARHAGLSPVPEATLPPSAVLPMATADAPLSVAEVPAADMAAVAARWSALSGFAPGAAQMARNHIVTFAGGHEATHFDMLRTRLLQTMRAQGWHRVAITSPGPGCGKSTLALNLAFSLARQPDLQTILCEMDLRRPSLARMLGLREKHHISRVLEGREPFDRNAVRFGENLAIATQATPARNPAELLHGPALSTALDGIESDWVPQVILCDLPPLFAADDAHAVIGRMDGVLIVAAAGSTTIAEIDRAEREIAAQTSVIGVVLNKCRYLPKDYGYDYYG